jgi:hypothetical protein
LGYSALPLCVMQTAAPVNCDVRVALAQPPRALQAATGISLAEGEQTLKNRAVVLPSHVVSAPKTSHKITAEGDTQNVTKNHCGTRPPWHALGHQPLHARVAHRIRRYLLEERNVGGVVEPEDVRLAAGGGLVHVHHGVQAVADVGVNLIRESG